MEQLTNLFQPVRFKRTKKSEWERGIKQMDKEGTKIMDYNTELVEKPYKVEVDWFLKM